MSSSGTARSLIAQYALVAMIIHVSRRCFSSKQFSSRWMRLSSIFLFCARSLLSGSMRLTKPAISSVVVASMYACPYAICASTPPAKKPAIPPAAAEKLVRNMSVSLLRAYLKVSST